mmetsp:Transcript_30816/g.89059  ORF Transcript_30816/g.89059 Transcript_30816/m.89059 type:complete len:231 (+) Transcript_30816:1745-2437(+)
MTPVGSMVLLARFGLRSLKRSSLKAFFTQSHASSVPSLRKSMMLVALRMTLKLTEIRCLTSNIVVSVQSTPTVFRVASAHLSGAARYHSGKTLAMCKSWPRPNVIKWGPCSLSSKSSNCSLYFAAQASTGVIDVSGSTKCSSGKSAPCFANCFTNESRTRKALQSSSRSNPYRSSTKNTKTLCQSMFRLLARLCNTSARRVRRTLPLVPERPRTKLPKLLCWNLTMHSSM